MSRHFYFSSWIERGRKMLWCSGTAAFNGLCVSPAFTCCMLCRHVIQSNMKKRYICVAYICLCCSEISFLSLAGIRKSPVPVLDWWGCGEILQPSIPPLAAVLPAGVKAGLFPSKRGIWVTVLAVSSLDFLLVCPGQQGWLCDCTSDDKVSEVW